MANKTFDIAEMVTNQIIAALEKGTIPWKRPWKTTTPLNLITKHVYQGINLLLLSLAEHFSPYYLTFKQIVSLGGSLKAGTKGYKVVYWKVLEYARKNNENEIERLEIPMMRYYTVFNLEQCSNIPSNKMPMENNNINPIKACEDIIINMPDKPDIVPSRKACYNRLTDVIGMPDINAFVSADEYYSTLFHEIVHSTGHDKRLGRLNSRAYTGDEESYSREELIAELGNAFLCAHARIAPNSIENQAAYIGNWLEVLKKDKRFLISASSSARLAVNYILRKSD